MCPDTQIDSLERQRLEMVGAQLRDRGISDTRVLDAMQRVPRHEFVAGEFRAQAYEDHPIPIGEGQTVSQPFMVALTLQAAAIQPSDVVLEIGTGSGYQSAILAELAREVYSVERIPALASSAQATLSRLGYSNLTVAVGDGSEGLPERAPFDVIVVSAAAPGIPPALLAQLAEQGRLIIPVGPAAAQELKRIRKQRGHPVVETLVGCRFVPLIGTQGYASGW
jgi:protein-L-isoaspartate(D-aspartate) O-methyltransferase